uniref:RNA helicase n=2 Tax=Tetraselmis sp. GSL018 TaxID=582737 RepID=A0A061RJP5_9CHLO
MGSRSQFSRVAWNVSRVLLDDQTRCLSTGACWASFRSAVSTSYLHLQCRQAEIETEGKAIVFPNFADKCRGGAALTSPRGGAVVPWLAQSARQAHQSSAEGSSVGGRPQPPCTVEELLANMGAKLKGSGGLSLTKREKRVVKDCLQDFSSSSWVQDEALELYIKSEIFLQVTSHFKKVVRRGITPALRDALMQVGPGEASQQLLFPLFAEWVLKEYKDEIANYREMVKSVDLRLPHRWYTMARSMKRRFIYHSGPTNSGKTFNALQALQSAERGLYCAPLRLLAMEVYDTCNQQGVFCSLITGQEKLIVPGANHTSCTIEMASTESPVDVAVIDEIQMIGDPQRGWAWTRALQGIPAQEIHLCGDSSASSLVRQIVEDMGEDLEFQSYDRFTPLEVEAEALDTRGGYAAVQRGDCVVAFSRRDIYAIKDAIEAETGLRACVVYGALPPEMRRIQARLFNDPNSGFDVMVASDAMGMGLNLNIRRVVFHTLEKFEGTYVKPVSVSMIKQISGRAGRRSSEWEKGLVTCFRSADISYLKEALSVPLADMNTPLAGIFPEFEHLELFASQVPGMSFPELLVKFAEESRLDGKYFFCKQDSLIEIAMLLNDLPGLSIRDRYMFCTAPVNTRDEIATSYLIDYANKYCRSEPCSLDIKLVEKPPETIEDLRELEILHQVTSLWLSLELRAKKEGVFVGREDAEAAARRIISLMRDSFANLSKQQQERQLQAAQKLRNQQMPGLSRQLHTSLSRRSRFSERQEARPAAALAGV